MRVIDSWVKGVEPMTKLAAQIGMWAAWAETLVGYVYLAGYMALVAAFPIKPWIDIRAFVADVNTPS